MRLLLQPAGAHKVHGDHNCNYHDCSRVRSRTGVFHAPVFARVRPARERTRPRTGRTGADAPGAPPRTPPANGPDGCRTGIGRASDETARHRPGTWWAHSVEAR
ncbi:hypothetical protein KNE206_50350 [Kitasatospora sp. NE20-6]